MKLAEFNGRVNRVINKEVIEELSIPWEETTVTTGLRKLLHEGSEVLQKLIDELEKKQHIIDHVQTLAEANRVRFYRMFDPGTCL